MLKQECLNPYLSVIDMDAEKLPFILLEDGFPLSGIDDVLSFFLPNFKNVNHSQIAPYNFYSPTS